MNDFDIYKLRKKPMHIFRLSVIIFVLILYVRPATAINPIPEESGFSGFVSIGTSAMSLGSNMVSGNKFGDVENVTLPSIYGKPETVTSIKASINGSLRYTFGSTRTQIYAGTMLEDLIRFDFSALLGVRQIVPGMGIVGVSYLFPRIPTEVWEDPYIENTKRIETQRTATGVQLSWEWIFGTMFHAKYSYRNNEIENEQSGSDPFLGLSPDQISLLDRNGKIHKTELAYLYRIGVGHLLNTAFKYKRYDMDGDSRANDQVHVQLTHTKRKEKFIFITNVTCGISEYDKENPIYNKKQEDNHYGLALSVFYMKPFNLDKWSIVTNISTYKKTSNIDFYEGRASLFNISALYRF